MLYAILAYHAEGVVESWTEEEDAALMKDLLEVNDRLVRERHLGPAARLEPTENAVTLRGTGLGLITDGPFAETKEQLLGFYVVDCPTLEDAIAVAEDLGRASGSAGAHEVRPLMLYRPGDVTAP